MGCGKNRSSKKAPSPDTQWENAFRSQLARTGDCPSVRRLLSKYGNIRTKTIRGAIAKEPAGH